MGADGTDGDDGPEGLEGEGAGAEVGVRVCSGAIHQS